MSRSQVNPYGQVVLATIFSGSHLVSGHLEERSTSSFPQVRSEALLECTNLRSFVFTPHRFPEALLNTTLETLPKCSLLQDLTVHETCCTEETASTLTKIVGLKKLTIEGPRRAILNLIPEWLERLSTTLTGLHLKVFNSCYVSVILKAQTRFSRTIVVRLRPVFSAR